jgi:hypothetical protein
MTVSRDPDRLIDAFVAEGPTELPDRVYDAVREQIEQTNQRVVIGPRRISDMHSFAKLAIAAAVLIAVGFAGVNLLPTNSSIGGVSATPFATPTASPTPTPTPTPVPTSVRLQPPTPPADAVPGDDSLMTAGSHSFYRNDGQTETRVSFSVPDGWYGHGSWYISNNPSDPLATDVASLAVWERSSASDAITYVFPDPCGYAVLPDPLGPTVPDLVDALIAQQSRDTSAPTDIIVGGYQGQAIETTLASDISCGGDGHIELWETQDTSARWLTPGMQQTIWILDVAGSRFVIEGTLGPDASDADRAALQQIMDSIQLTVS